MAYPVKTDKNIYKEGLMELRAPQDGVIKDLATTTVFNRLPVFMSYKRTVLEYLMSPVQKAVKEAGRER